MSDEKNFEVWRTLPTIESKIDALVTYGYLSRPLRVQHSNSSYDFNDEFLLWCFVRCQAIVSDFIFINPTFVVEDFAVKRSNDSFNLTPDGLYATPPANLDNILFFPILAMPTPLKLRHKFFLDSLAMFGAVSEF